MQSIASPSNTRPSRYQPPPNAWIFESQFKSVPIRSVRETLQREEIGDEHKREASNAMNGRRMNPEIPTPRTQENFGVSYSLLQKKSP